MQSTRTARRLAPALLIALLGAPTAAPAQGAAGEPGAGRGAAGDSGARAAEEKIDVFEGIDFFDADELEAMVRKRRGIAVRDPMRARVGRYLSRAAKENDEGDVAEGERLLHRLLESRLNDLERGNVYRYLGFLAYGDGRPEDAIGYFEQALDTGALQIRDDVGMRVAIAQLNMQIGEWQEAIDWFRESLRYMLEADPRSLYYMALSSFQLKEYDYAIAYTLKAIELAEQPEEAWLRLLAALYAQDQRYAEAIPVLEELVLRYPKRTYWVQLSLMYAAKGDFASSLVVQQAADLQGYLRESKELLRFARSYLYYDLPYSAAQLLDEEITSGRIEPDQDSYELLANSWIAAREYDASLAPLQNAARLSEDGKLYVRLGQVHMQREEWDEASEVLREAIDKGQLEDVGHARVLLGIALLNLDRLGEAENQFQRARAHEKSRTEADRWLDHIARERRSAQS